jgi:hypothetical protein
MRGAWRERREMNKSFVKQIFGLLAGLVCTGLAYAEVLVSPPVNTQVYSGKTVQITVDSTNVDMDLEVGLFVKVGGGGFFAIPNSISKIGAKPLVLDVLIPDKVTGPVKLIMVVKGLTSGTIEHYTHTFIAVPDSSEQLTNLNLLTKSLHFDSKYLSPPASKQRIFVNGKYDSGITRDVHRGLTGTLYRSSDTSIATVDSAGYVTPVGPGHAVITVEHGEHQAYATVHVDDPTTGEEPVTDVSAAVAVTRGGFRKDPATGEYTQQLTLTNTSPQPIASPLKLVLSNLDPAIDLRDSELTVRYTDNIEPVESPYYSVKLGAHNVLLPSEQVYFTARFRNPQNIPITYDYQVFVGSDL